jgi:dipeptidase E
MLYIYSGEVPELDSALRETLGPNHTLTLIPASPSDLGEARHVTSYFHDNGLRARTRSARYYRDPSRLRQIIMNSDAVYLMGGNTFDFLHYAQRVNLFAILQEFEEMGGIILSESAGSIILSPNIATALLPTSCPDEHTLELESYLGMGRIPFHVSPHFDTSAPAIDQDLDELQALAHYSNCPVMLIKDGEGMILEGNCIVHTVGQPRELSPAERPSSSLQVENVLPDWARKLPSSI